MKPLEWLLHNNNILFVWLEGEYKLLQFIRKLNEFHSSLEFTCKHSRTKMNFLDVIVEIDKFYSRKEDLETHLQDLSSWLNGLKIEHIQHGS